MSTWRVGGIGRKPHPVLTSMFLVLLFTVAGSLRPAVAGAQEASIRLVGQSFWVGLGGDFRMDVALEGALVGPADVEVRVGERVATRSDFALSLEDDAPVRGRLQRFALDSLPVSPEGVRTVQIGVRDPSRPTGADRLRLSGQGVFPVHVSLVDQRRKDVVSAFTTHLVHLPRPPEQITQPEQPELAVAVVLPVHAPPALQPDGTRQLPPEQADRLGSLVEAVAARPGLPLTLRPTPETLEGLAQGRQTDKDTLRLLASQTGGPGRQLLAAPYVPARLPDLVSARLGGEVDALLDRGLATTTLHLGKPASVDTWLESDTLDARTLARLQDRGVRRLLLPETSLVPTDLSRTLTSPFALGTQQGPVAVAVDAGLASHFEHGDPVLGAHHLLADLAVLAFDRPGRQRGVVVAPPLTWNPDPQFLDVLLDGLTVNPLADPTTADSVLDKPLVELRNRPLVRQLQAPGTNRLPAQRLAGVRQEVEAVSSLVADPVRSAPLQDQMLVATSSLLTDEQRRAYLDGLHRQVVERVGAVRMQDDRAITLTSRTGDIPITIRNDLDHPVRVRLSVRSDRLSFPQGETRDLELSRRDTTEQLRVQARTSGEFPLVVELRSANGALLLGRSRVLVRSTAASWVGLSVTVGSAAFLVLWWGRHLWGSRRLRAPA